MDELRRQALSLRARVYSLIRAFFAQRAVIEVDTPMLGQGASTDVHIRSFDTGYTGPGHGGARRRFLRTSPEFWHKRLLAEGIGDCYELGRVFRDGEFGRRHNPEFTLLEWYRVGWQPEQLMDEVELLVRNLMLLSSRPLRSVDRMSYRELFRRYLEVDPMTTGDDELRRMTAAFWVDAERLDRDACLDVLLTHRIEPVLPEHGLTFVYGYPPSQAALARVVEDSEGHRVAERFELYLGRVELANGFHELSDAGEQARRFEADNRERERLGQEPMPPDQRLLTALEDGLPDCSGVAVGIDRLLMAMLDTLDIRDVLAFAFDEA